MDFFEDRVAPGLKAREGAYVNDPSDPGGETNHGITARLAHACGYAGDMRAMTWDQAKAIYRQHFYVEGGIAQVATFAPDLAVKLMDVGVNQGLFYAGKFLQIALNAFNRRGADYADVIVDGDIGKGTIRALNDFMAVRKAQGGEAVLISAVRCLQGARYLNLADGNPALEDFEFGWFKQRVAL
jgi:lysozyme family protein